MKSYLYEVEESTFNNFTSLCDKTGIKRSFATKQALTNYLDTQKPSEHLKVIRLPIDAGLDTRLTAIAESTGKTKKQLVNEALKEWSELE